MACFFFGAPKTRWQPQLFTSQLGGIGFQVPQNPQRVAVLLGFLGKSPFGDFIWVKKKCGVNILKLPEICFFLFVVQCSKIILFEVQGG